MCNACQFAHCLTTGDGDLMMIACLLLAFIFTKSLVNSKVPCDWKIANVAPIHKAGDKAIMANYI